MAARTFLARMRDEPVLVLAVVDTLLTLAVAFGAELSGHEVALITTALTGLFALIARSRVRPGRQE